jgi:cytochrome c oxidase subunit 2
MVVLVYISPEPIGLVAAGDPADAIDSLFKFLGAVAAVIFNIVVIYTVYFAIVFRKPPNAPASTIGVQIHDAPILEFWWTAIPTVLVVILAIFSTKIWLDIQRTLPAGGLTVEAIGYQFGFQFRYPKLADPITGELHLPAGVPVTVDITSRDVLHGFWVPELRMKADMVPGQVAQIHVTPTVAGTYRIICTEFCGVAHSNMYAKLVIEPKADFDRWFAKQGGVAAAAAGPSNLAAGDAAAGSKLFASKCTTCHSVGPFSQKVVGPGLGKLLSDPDHPKLVDGDPATPENVAKILKNGYSGDIGVMPNASMNGLNGTDIANLTAYIAGLSK